MTQITYPINDCVDDLTDEETVVFGDLSGRSLLLGLPAIVFILGILPDVWSLDDSRSVRRRYNSES